MRTVARVGLEEAARLAGRSKSTLLRHIRAGTLAASKGRGNSWQIDKAELSRAYGATPSAQNTAGAAAPADREEVLRLQGQVRELEAELAKRVRELEAKLAKRVRELEVDLAESRAEIRLECGRREQLGRELVAAQRLAGNRNHVTPPYAGPDPVLRALTRVSDRWRDWWEGPI